MSRVGQANKGKFGPAHPRFVTGRYYRRGYVFVLSSGHPWPRKSGRVLEHVAVMEVHLGRRLLPGEVVHHINENRADNRLENLLLTRMGVHTVEHHPEVFARFMAAAREGRLRGHEPRTHR